MQAHLAKPVRREALEAAIATWARRHSGNVRAAPAPTTPPPAEPLPASLVARYAERRAALAATLRAFGPLAADDPQAIAALLSDIHKLAGTAGHFGDVQLGDKARETERMMIDATPGERIILAQALLSVIETSSQNVSS